MVDVDAALASARSDRVHVGVEDACVEKTKFTRLLLTSSACDGRTSLEHTVTEEEQRTVGTVQKKET